MPESCRYGPALSELQRVSRRNRAKGPDPFLLFGYTGAGKHISRRDRNADTATGAIPDARFSVLGTSVRSRAPRSLPRADVPSAMRMKDKGMGKQYEQIYRFENLYQAWRLAKRSKSRDAEVQRFSLDLGNRLWSLHDRLKARSYVPGGYYHFTITEPKKREIYALHFEDRVVQHSICDNLLRPWMEARLIYDCAACRIGKGTHFAMDRLSGFLREFYRRHGTSGYVLKCDIRKYFDNIDHQILKDRLSKFPDKEVLRLLFSFVDAYNGAEGKGIPLGNQSSQWFALYYLDPVDRLVKEKLRVRWYTRYMDDFLLLHPSKEYLKHCLAEIRALADELKLELNDKTQIFPLKQGVDYLGFHFYLTETGKVVRLLRTSGKRRFKRKMKAMRKSYEEGGITLEEIGRSLASYRGHLSHGNTYRMRAKTFSHFVLRPPRKKPPRPP